MKVGDLVMYREEYDHGGGLGFVVKTNPIYAFVKWAKIPGTFIANKEHLEMIEVERDYEITHNMRKYGGKNMPATYEEPVCGCRTCVPTAHSMSDLYPRPRYEPPDDDGDDGGKR